jgi:toxin HigB-1
VPREFPPRWIAAVLQHGIKAWDSAESCELSLRVLRLDGVTSALDMNLPGWDWHPLKDALAGHWAVSVNGNWPLTFTFEGTRPPLKAKESFL